MPRQATPNLSIASLEFQHVKAQQTASRKMPNHYRSILNRLLRNVGDIHVGSLKPKHLEDFFYGHGGLSETAKRQTLANYRQYLKGFLDYCHRREWSVYTGDQLLAGIRSRSTHVNRDRYRMDRLELVDLVSAAVDPRDRALVSFVANTAVRIHEALGMRVCDVNLDRGELYVTRMKPEEHTVTYPITADLDVELRAWLGVYASTMATEGEKLSRKALLFPAKHESRFAKGAVRKAVQREGYKPFSPISEPRKVIQPIADRAGIELEPGDGWHTIRRSVSRIFFDDASASGHDAALRLTQALLGHKHAQTTEGYLGLSHEKAQVDKILRGQPFIAKGLDVSGKIASLDEHRDRRAV